MNLVRFLAVALALLLTDRAALPQDSKKNDPALEAAKKSYDQEMHKIDDALQVAKKKADEDAAKAREKLIKVYDEVIKRTTQKGDLETANALLAEKKALAGGEGEPADKDKNIALKDLIGHLRVESVDSNHQSTDIVVKFNDVVIVKGGKQGFNVVAIDKQGKTLLNEAYRPLATDAAPASNMLEAIKQLKNGVCVIVTVKALVQDDQIKDAKVVEALRLIGAGKLPATFGAYICIGYKGAKPGEAITQVGGKDVLVYPDDFPK